MTEFVQPIRIAVIALCALAGCADEAVRSPLASPPPMTLIEPSEPIDTADNDDSPVILPDREVRPTPPPVSTPTPTPDPEMAPAPSPEPTPEVADDGPGIAVESCDFDFGFDDVPAQASDRQRAGGAADDGAAEMPADLDAVYPIAHMEPLPSYYWRMAPDLSQLPTPRAAVSIRSGIDDLVMPGYGDDMPVFTRAAPWTGERRCYVLPTGARLLTEAEAHRLWVSLVEATLWLAVDEAPGQRTVVGLRGAYPGTFEWHQNAPNRFNDTLVLLWREADGTPHVREFPVNTDTGSYNFGYHSSSSLTPNRQYRYVNGWHRSYNALRMDLPGYPVRDDANKNGHWDSDRNGWLSGGSDDHDRNGSAHNIHMASVDGRLGEIPINRWSAGCQVIPGMENWIEFIGNAWTQTGDAVEYFLVDARDIAPSLWSPCAASNGTHDCPLEIRAFPYVHRGDTSQSIEHYAATYNCSEADEGGAEEVFVVNIRRSGTLSIAVETDDDDNIDPDIHLLMGDDRDACLARGHREVSRTVGPGRYVIVVDTWVDSAGRALAGPYRLHVNLR